jgi:hypothetical protein
MKVAVISSSIASGARIAREIEKNPQVEAWVLAFDPIHMNPLKRILREVYHFASPGLFLPALLMAIKRRVRFFPKAIGDPASLRRIRKHGFDLGCLDLNVIYRRPMIDAFGRGILNSHIGILPRYRGRCVAEWSVLEGNPNGITVFFIDEGIDTGRDIVIREKVPVSHCTSIAGMKMFLFRSDAEMYRKALAAILAEKELLINDVDQGLRFYPMSRLFLNVVEKVLQAR